MSLDAYTLTRKKELILAFIRARGPSLPVHIARDVKTSPLFASAFLSELYNEQKLRMSHLKVGSYSLYLLQGQENLLENFIQFLNHKEQEAFNLIKQNRLLIDEQLTPAIRVAMREIKDFAIPIKANINNAEKILWKYAFLADFDFQNLVQKIILDKPSQEIKPALSNMAYHLPSTESAQSKNIQSQVSEIKEKIQQIKKEISQEIEKPEEEKEEK